MAIRGGALVRPHIIVIARNLSPGVRGDAAPGVLFIFNHDPARTCPKTFIAASVAQSAEGESTPRTLWASTRSAWRAKREAMRNRICRSSPWQTRNSLGSAAAAGREIAAQQVLGGDAQDVGDAGEVDPHLAGPVGLPLRDRAAADADGQRQLGLGHAGHLAGGAYSRACPGGGVFGKPEGGGGGSSGVAHSDDIGQNR